MKPKSSRAFSLLEIVIAMLIIGLVVAGLFGLFVTSHGFIGNAGRRLQAIQYARRVAETLKVYVSASNTPPAPAAAGTGPGAALDEIMHPASRTPDLIGLPNTITTNNGTVLTCTYNVDEDVEVVPGTPTTLERATVTVSWTEP